MKVDPKPAAAGQKRKSGIGREIDAGRALVAAPGPAPLDVTGISINDFSGLRTNLKLQLY